MDLKTLRLRIRGLRAEDAPLLYAYSREPGAAAELPDEVLSSREAAEQLIACLAENDAAGEYPLVYAIALLDTDALIGHISLSPIDDSIEVGYAISEGYQGRGYAKEAVRAFAAWATEARGIGRLYGYAKAANAASWRVLEEAGFTFFGERERDFFGGRHLTRHYVLEG